MARSVRLSDDQAWSVLEAAHTGIFTTLRRDGWPIALPVWFVALDRRIYVSGPAGRKKFARVRNDPRASFLVESGLRWAELVGVQVNGPATILADPARLDEVAAAFDAKYERFRTPRKEMPAATRDRYAVEAGTIEIVPEGRILSWDNSRLFDDGDAK
jgi:nitroimidazol reductase NimA-like FMN-containing flavoprotein (pyridoxamine 5'-phosphate oxidase superfamily)